MFASGIFPFGILLSVCIYVSADSNSENIGADLTRKTRSADDVLNGFDSVFNQARLTSVGLLNNLGGLGNNDASEDTAKPNFLQRLVARGGSGRDGRATSRSLESARPFSNILPPSPQIDGIADQITRFQENGGNILRSLTSGNSGSNPLSGFIENARNAIKSLLGSPIPSTRRSRPSSRQMQELVQNGGGSDPFAGIFQNVNRNIQSGADGFTNFLRTGLRSFVDGGTSRSATPSNSFSNIINQGRDALRGLFSSRPGSNPFSDAIAQGRSTLRRLTSGNPFQNIFDRGSSSLTNGIDSFVRRANTGIRSMTKNLTQKR